MPSFARPASSAPSGHERLTAVTQALRDVTARIAIAALVGMAPCFAVGAAEYSEIKSDEKVVFFPTVASKSDNGETWEADVHGWIFEPERDDLLRAAAVHEIREALGLDPSEPATQVFIERVRLFLVDNERNKRVGIRVAGESFVLDKSARDGHFTGTVRVSAEAVATLLRKRRTLPFEAILPDGDKRQFSGAIHCLGDEGTSVISDIDDTIKITGVTDKTELVRNTFFRPFKPVDGMAKLFDQWSKAGADFHYVSAAPWQLYEPLAAFAAAERYPAGTFHLKRIRLKDETFFNLFADPVEYKMAIIEPLLARFPKRKFILVGDSGEKDAEVYGTVARRFPAQVERIYVRDATGEKPDAARYQRAFAGVPAEKWQVFGEPKQVRWPRE